ncbi:protein K4-like protein [Leptotrombidium deliense]|uniref:Protein K4-like protein n=1 Tax=Leptotrombidium deliense TaxID=299467 RepID=A0A443RZ41_9ACAR|nr:protein K4-like protein [Leptotrombidium deliense]
MSTFYAFLSLINNAKHSLDIAALELSLLCEDQSEEVYGCKIGEIILNSIINATKIRNVNVRIALSTKFLAGNTRINAILLAEAGVKIQYVSMERGALKTKLLIADKSSAYIGSAYLDWRSCCWRCKQVVRDMNNIFELYWIFGKNNSALYSVSLLRFSTKYNIENPMKINSASGITEAYVCSSPKKFNAIGRTDAIKGLLQVIENAETFIHINVLSFLPIFKSTNKYWPDIDVALRTAVISKNVSIKFMVGKWPHTSKDQFVFLQSLDILSQLKNSGNFHSKLFKLPALPEKVEYTRFSRNNYMITDKQVFIGTLEWNGNYFAFDTGIAFVATYSSNENNLRKTVESIFERDWNSQYTLSQN